MPSNRELILIWIFNLFFEIWKISLIVAAQLFVDWIEDSDDLATGLWRAFLVILLSLIIVFAETKYVYSAKLLAVKINRCVTSLLYQKVMKLSQKSLALSSTGKLVTLVSSELQTIEKSFRLITYVLTSIVIFFIAFGIFAYYYKEAAAIAFGALLLFIVIIVGLNLIIMGVLYKASHYSDLRVKIITDLINGIKTIKAYCWETIFYEKVKYYRDLQLQNMKKSVYLMSAAIPFLFCGGYMLGTILIGYHWAAGNKIEYSSAILLLTYWIYLSISVIPSFFSGLHQNFKLINILKRVDEVMNKTEINEIDHEINESEHSDAWILMKNVTASWGFKIEQDIYTGKKEIITDQTTNSLSNIDFEAHNKDFISIIGPVGSGKTTLLVGIMKELELKEGQI